MGFDLQELEQVALVLPLRDGPLFTRELVYTAVTRARRGATLVGPGALLAAGIGRTLGRFSGLGERLADADRGKASQIAVIEPR